MHSAVFRHHMLSGYGSDAATRERAVQQQVETGPRQLIGVPVLST